MSPVSLRNEIEVRPMGNRRFEGWKIYCSGSRCGFIKFNVISEKAFKNYASVEFLVPKPMRGRHIGRIALKMAITRSKYSKFHARLRKTNIASLKSLSAVGFRVHSDQRQYVMVYETDKVDCKYSPQYGIPDHQ